MSFSTALVKITDAYAPMIERQLTANGVSMDQYSKQCVVNAIGAINAVLDGKGVSWNDPQLDKNNVTQILLNVAALKLNAAASPREVYFQLRNVKVTIDGKDVWKKQIEMGIEGDGNDAILARFGRGVKQVRPFWLVREQDYFEYPTYSGLEMTPPKWTPTGKGEVVRVVYPIIFQDDSIQFFIAERDDVAKNLIAHINNNLMNETFGFAKSRFDAKPDDLKKINAKKKEILDKAKNLGLDALDDPELQQWISPAWKEYQSREQMLIRKMRNNIVKKIPKDFGNAFVEMIHSEATDPEYADVRREIEANANSEPIDIVAGPVEKEQALEEPMVEPEHPKQETPKTVRETKPVGQEVPKMNRASEPPVDDRTAQAEILFGDEPVAAGPGF